MKTNFENILKAIIGLSDNNKKYIINNLKEINNTIILLKNKVNKMYIQTGIPSQENLNDDILKAFEVLKIYGFNEYSFIGLTSDFINWFIVNTTNKTNYNPKLMNFNLLTSFKEAYFIAYAQNQSEIPTYNQVKKILLTFDQQIEDYKKESKKSLIELINNLDGKS